MTVFRTHILFLFTLVYAPASQGFTSQNLPPPYFSTFGMADVSSTGVLDIKIVSVTGAVLYSKTLQPETSAADPCTVSLSVYNAGTNAKVVTVPSNGVVTSPPCNVNIEVALTCTPPFTYGAVYIELLSGSRVLKFRNETAAPYFLFGNNGADVLAGSIPGGIYTIRTTAGGKTFQPSLLNLGSCS
jgi:hypothetical protein